MTRDTHVRVISNLASNQVKVIPSVGADRTEWEFVLEALSGDFRDTESALWQVCDVAMTYLYYRQHHCVVVGGVSGSSIARLLVSVYPQGSRTELTRAQWSGMQAGSRELAIFVVAADRQSLYLELPSGSCLAVARDTLPARTLHQLEVGQFEG